MCFPTSEVLQKRFSRLHVWCICENTVKKGEGEKGEMFIRYQLMNN